MNFFFFFLNLFKKIVPSSKKTKSRKSISSAKYAESPTNQFSDAPSPQPVTASVILDSTFLDKIEKTQFFRQTDEKEEKDTEDDNEE